MTTHTRRTSGTPEPVDLGGWCCCHDVDDVNATRIHVHPLDDLIGHDLDDEGDCPCGPAVEITTRAAADLPDSWLITHASLDGREANE